MIELLVAERDALGRRVVLEHDHVDLVVHLEQLRRMADAAPRHVGDVQQPVDAAQVDERAVVGDVLDDALEDLALGEHVERVLLLFGVLFLEQRLARQHDVAALLVHLDDAHAQLLPAQRVEVANRAHVDLRSGQERADADVDGQPALDALDDAADDDLALGVGLLDLVPDLHLLRFFAGQDDVAFAILGALEQDVDDVAGLHGDLAALVEELGELDDAFGLVADVDDDFRRRDLENGALDDLAFRDVAEAVIVDVEELGVLVRIDLVVVVARPRFQRVLVGAGRCVVRRARVARGLRRHRGPHRECSRLLRSPCRAGPPGRSIAGIGRYRVRAHSRSAPQVGGAPAVTRTPQSAFSEFR